jgi:hypothetical protein
MKQTFFSCALAIAAFSIFPSSIKVEKDRFPHNGFTLSFTTHGMGGNTYDLQPMFKVRGTQFLYSIEEAWIAPGRALGKPDTICTGILRPGSIDSIIRITEAIKDTSIQLFNRHISSGLLQYLTVKTAHKKLVIDMLNKSHPAAVKIIDILNSNIPAPYPRLFVTSSK